MVKGKAPKRRQVQIPPGPRELTCPCAGHTCLPGAHGALSPEPAPRPGNTSAHSAHTAPGLGPPDTASAGLAGICPDLRGAGKAEVVGARAGEGHRNFRGCPLNRRRGEGGCQQGTLRREHSQGGAVREGQPRPKLQTCAQGGPPAAATRQRGQAEPDTDGRARALWDEVGACGWSGGGGTGPSSASRVVLPALGLPKALLQSKRPGRGVQEAGWSPQRGAIWEPIKVLAGALAWGGRGRGLPLGRPHTTWH